MDRDIRNTGRTRGSQTITAADKAQAREVSLRRIGRLFSPYRWQLAIVTAFIVASSVVGLASPFLLRAVIDDALPHRNLTLLAWLVIGMVAVAAISSAFGVVQTWISTKVGQHVMHELRTSVFTHLQRQSIAFFTRTRTGEVQSRIQNDIGGMESVEVTTDSIPPMSFWMRDWTSPVRVRVKNAIDCRCRWPNTAVRSPCMTCWPTLVLIQVWITPRAEVIAATATMPMTSQVSSFRFFSGSALSMTARSRNGEARLTTEEAAMMAVTMPSGQR